MYHKGYVFLGIVLFLALLAMPYWVSAGKINTRMFVRNCPLQRERLAYTIRSGWQSTIWSC